MTTKDFSEWISQIDGIEVVKFDEEKILFFCSEENLVIKLTDVAEKTNTNLSIRTHEQKICFCLNKDNLDQFVSFWHRENKKGLPDLSWVTVKQMASELKSRDNLTFALVWIEDSGYDNISLEASGNPTTLCGMLSRGLNLAIKYADKNINFHEPKDDK